MALHHLIESPEATMRSAFEVDRCNVLLTSAEVYLNKPCTEQVLMLTAVRSQGMILYVATLYDTERGVIDSRRILPHMNLVVLQ